MEVVPFQVFEDSDADAGGIAAAVVVFDVVFVAAVVVDVAFSAVFLAATRFVGQGIGFAGGVRGVDDRVVVAGLRLADFFAMFASPPAGSGRLIGILRLAETGF